MENTGNTWGWFGEQIAQMEGNEGYGHGAKVKISAKWDCRERSGFINGVGKLKTDLSSCTEWEGESLD